MFNEKPLKVASFELLEREVRPVGKPSIDQWAVALEFAASSDESAPYWVGGLVAYADTRAEWREKLSQAMSVTRLSEQRLHDLAYLYRHVAAAERDLAPSVEHARAVAPLPQPEQRKWLKKARTEGWTRREMKQEIQASQKRGVISGTAELEGMFRVWLVDFPWKYNQAEPSGVSAQSRYPGMTVDEGIAMADQVRAHAMKNAVAFFWVTAPFVYYASDGISPDPYRIITSWGFEPKTGAVWDKVKHNFGHYFSVRHEHLIVATRGVCTPDRPTPMFDSVFTEQASDVHSQKPEMVAKMVERLYDGPYVELFARDQREGWTCWGNQVNAPLLRPKKRA
jgi:N6-adenosine-specific RNA methylase IME4